MNLVKQNAKFIVAAIGTVIVGIQSSWDWAIVGPSLLATLALWGVPNSSAPTQ